MCRLSVSDVNVKKLPELGQNPLARAIKASSTQPPVFEYPRENGSFFEGDMVLWR